MGLLDVLGLQPKAPVAAVAGAPAGEAEDTQVKAGSGGDATVADIAQQGLFAGARVVAVLLINGLKAHPQTAAIQAFITQANTKLATADGHAAKSEWPQAMQALEDVKAIAATAKKAADDRQAFTVKLADVTMGMNAFQNVSSGTFNLLSNAIANANAQATANNAAEIAAAFAPVATASVIENSSLRRLHRQAFENFRLGLKLFAAVCANAPHEPLRASHDD